MRDPNLVSADGLVKGGDLIKVEGRYYHAEHDEAEDWYGPYPSREAAIEGAREDDDCVHDGEDGRSFLSCAIGKGLAINVTRSIQADQVLERVDGFLEGILLLDEPWSEYMRVTKEQTDDLESRLRRAMAEWLVEHRIESFMIDPVETVREDVVRSEDASV